MKKMLLAILALVLSLNLIACSAEGPSEEHQSNGESFFEGEVLEVKEGYLLVCVTSSDDGALTTGSEVTVSTDVMSAAGTPDVAVGDVVRVSFNGVVMERYPLGLGAVYEIWSMDSAEETAETDTHTHQLAETAQMVEHDSVGYCGNTMTTVTCDAWEVTFSGGESVFLTDLLRHLDYREGVCRCAPEYRVDTEFGTDYGLSLREGYARYKGAQVSLTEEQIEEIREIMEKIAP